MTPFLPHGNHWITVQDQPFVLSDGSTLLVPKGFVFDGHSLPPVVLPWISPYTNDVYAALLHDFYYRYKIGTRKQADFEYLHQMQQLGTNAVRRYTFYYFVRLVSWLFW